MPTATSPKIIAIVVVSIALLAIIGVLTLSWCIISVVSPDAVLLTAYVGITTGAVGTLSGLLINTRSSTPNPEPTPTVITNSTSNPVNVEPVAKTEGNP